MLRSVIVLFFLATVVSAGFAQKKERKRKQAQAAARQQPNSLNPYYPLADYAPEERKMSRSAVKNTGITFDQEVQDYYDRKAKVLKEEARWERISKRPQYSDPSYFGHKHKPKKHPPGKMKYCKECGIWH